MELKGRILGSGWHPDRFEPLWHQGEIEIAHANGGEWNEDDGGPAPARPFPTWPAA